MQLIVNKKGNPSVSGRWSCSHHPAVHHTTALPIFFEHPTLQCTKRWSRWSCSHHPAVRVVRCIPLHSTLLPIAVIFFKAPDPIYSACPYPSHYISTFLSYSPTVRSLYLLTDCSKLILILTVRSALRCTSTTLLHWSSSQQPASLIWKLQNILRRMQQLNHPFTLIVSFLHWQWRFKFKTSGVHSIAHYTELFGHCYLDFFGDHQYQSVVLTKSRITHCWV